MSIKIDLLFLNNPLLLLLLILLMILLMFCFMQHYFYKFQPIMYDDSVLKSDRCKKLKEQKLSFKDLKDKVSQYTINEEFIKSYESLKQAEIETGINRKNISKMINGKINTSGGYIWKRTT
jgi:hypothetical protein